MLINEARFPAPYDAKPEMVFFDVGGTLFRDGKCVPSDGFRALRLASEDPDITDDPALAALWDEYIAAVSGAVSDRGDALETPLSAVLRYAEMTAGLRVPLTMPEQEELFDRYNSSREVIEGVPELLETLKTLGIRYAVISNNMMSGDGLELSIRRWIPCAEPEFCLTSADLLFT